MNTYLGTHILLDFENFYNENINLKNLAQQTFNIMQDSIIINSTMKIMHCEMVLLTEPETENGFTSVLLLDASHMTAHAYTDENKALLAMDIFTCGETDTTLIADYVIREIKNIVPKVKNVRYEIKKRFYKNLK